MTRKPQHNLPGCEPGALEHRRVNVERLMEQAHELRARYLHRLMTRMTRTIVRFAAQGPGTVKRWLRRGFAGTDSASHPVLAQR